MVIEANQRNYIDHAIYGGAHAVQGWLIHQTVSVSRIFCPDI